MSSTQVIVGAVLQALGFALVLVDLHLIRRSEGRTVQLLARIRAAFARSKSVIIEGAVASASMSSGRARLQVRREVARMEGQEQIDALIFNLGEVEKELDEAWRLADSTAEELRRELKTVREEITATQTQIEEQIKEREKDEEQVKNRSDLLQGAALLLFVVGLALTTIGSV